jgi:hypothetical protein
MRARPDQFRESRGVEMAGPDAVPTIRLLFLGHVFRCACGRDAAACHDQIDLAADEICGQCG